MKIWAPLLIVLLHLATTCCAASDDGVYPFKGSLDIVSGVLQVSLKSHEGQIDLQVDRKPDGSYQAFWDVQNIHFSFFELTTQIRGVIQVNQDSSGESKLSARLQSQNTVLNGHSGIEFSTDLNVHKGVINITQLEWAGLKAEGRLIMEPPFPVEARVTLYEMDIIDALNWLADPDKIWAGNGTVSGDIVLSGHVNKLALKANLLSQNGFIEDLPYDLLKLNLQGIYPMIDLAGSRVTKTDGFSVGLAGMIDLSDRTNMVSQIKAIKRIPLIEDDQSRSEWVLKKSEDGDGDGSRETHLFLKNDRQHALSGQEESTLLGVEKKIGF